MDGAPFGGKNRGTQNRSQRFDDDRPTLAKKTDFRPHLSLYWKIPPEANAAFVAAMEDVLAVYHLPSDPLFPVVCMDEPTEGRSPAEGCPQGGAKRQQSNQQLVGEVHPPIPLAPGHGEILDHEYVRHGVADIFLEIEPLAGVRHVEITARRSAGMSTGC